MKEELKLLQASRPSFEKHEHEAMPESARGHKTIEEVAECPNCKPKVMAKLRPEIEAELRPALMKEVSAKLKSKDLVTCNGCGEFVNKSDPECPNCHGKTAH